jgi:hypothetical protein
MDFNPITTEVRQAAEGIVKCRTVAPLHQTPVMPVQPFVDLFSNWPDNSLLSVKQLRLKTISLMALVFMLRPSDIAPRSQLSDPTSGNKRNIVFSVDNLDFSPDGGLTVTFHGIKNDYDRDGFTVTLPPLPPALVKFNPVLSLQDYIKATSVQRSSVPYNPVFLTLNKPYHAIDASTMSAILCQAIKLAGLSSPPYTAKSFRPTGATHAIDSGLHPDVARHIGRWRSQDTFEKHYVHTKVPASYVPNLLLSTH